MTWHITEAKRTHVELEHVDPRLAQPEYPRHEVDFSAVAKWDGCCHLYFGGHNNDTNPNGPDYVHVCNGVDSLDEMISFLAHVRDAAIKHFAWEGSADGDAWRDPNAGPSR